MKWYVEGVIPFSCAIEADNEDDALAKFDQLTKAVIAEMGEVEVNVVESEEDRNRAEEEFKKQLGPFGGAQ